MRLLKRLMFAWIACSTMASCANSPKPTVELQPPLPAEYSVRCPPPVLPASRSADDTVITLKTMYDLYGVCAGRLVDLRQWIEGRGKR